MTERSTAQHIQPRTYYTCSCQDGVCKLLPGANCLLLTWIMRWLTC
jgi:hypothetical protein